MPTVEINPGDSVQFLDGNGNVKEEFDYDTNNSVLRLEDANGNPADVVVGVSDAERVEFDDTAEATVTKGSASGTTDLDLSKANTFRVEAIDNITITFSNVTATPAGNSVTIYIVDSDGGGSYTISWPSSFVWNGGSAVGSVAQSSNVEVGVITDDGGTEWRGRKSGEGFA